MNRNGIFKVLLLAIALMFLSAPLSFNLTDSPSDHRSVAPVSPAAPFQSGQRGNDTGGAESSEDVPRIRTAISVSTELVNLQVRVTDPKGNVITGLGPNNFTVYEDKVRQEITNFSPIEANITAVLLVEYRKYGYYALDDMFIEQILNITDTFVRNMRRGDWVGVIGYDLNPIILSDFTQEPQKIVEAMHAINFPAMSEANLFDALIDTLDRVQESDNKTAVILLSTGVNTFSKNTYDEVLKKCQRSTATIYAISLGQLFRTRYGDQTAAKYLLNGISTSSIDLSMADTQLRYFSEYTGGEVYFPRFDSELPAIIGNISAFLRSQYSIGYVSSNTVKDGKFRKIRVEVNSDLMQNGKPVKLKIQTRKGYLPSKN